MAWTVNKQGKACAVCGKELAGGSEVVSSLEYSETGLIRLDRCPGCHPSGSEKVFSFWRRTVPKPEEKPPDATPRLKQFFDNLLATERLDPMKEKTLFLLALALMRKRILKQIASNHADGVEHWTLRRAGDGTEVQIVVPNVSPNELEALRAQLAAMLDFEV
ncbi:MAG: hypothetical protein RDV41_12075 [Planctomycetota bacterium]|nr:hypothetical protein [Planctomycetota bacterium]